MGYGCFVGGGPSFPINYTRGAVSAHTGIQKRVYRTIAKSTPPTCPEKCESPQMRNILYLYTYRSAHGGIGISTRVEYFALFNATQIILWVI